MSRVLVVARTRMNQGRVCVGAHDLDKGFRSLRLLTKAGMNIKENAEIDVGEIWELSYEAHPEPDPPHVEDVLVGEGERIESLPLNEVRAHILESETPWTGGPGSLFDGTVTATPSGRVYVPGEGPLPDRSTGYWTPDEEIVKHSSYGKEKFLYVGSGELSEFTWAGMADPPPRIAAGALVRVSLPRWHDPAKAPAGYYTQMSGVY